MKRVAARKHAFTLIYQIPFHENFDAGAVYKDFLSRLVSDGFNTDTPPEYIKAALDGVWEHISEIDALITAHLQGWDIDRIAKTDLAALRLCIYEILFVPSIPLAVSINEAVELAKNYGTDDSKAFVNGILASIAKQRGESSAPKERVAGKEDSSAPNEQTLNTGKL